MTWNTLDVPLETGWQCTLFPVKQYDSMMRRGYDEMSARWLYPNAGEDDWPSWNTRSPDEQEKRRRWNDAVRRQLAEDRRMFAGYFRPNLDLRSITGGNAMREIQTYVRDFLNVAHWNLPTDNAGVKKLLNDAVAAGRLVPVVNREYRGMPRVAQPDPAPQFWPATGDGGYAYRPKVLTGSEFLALQRANGELSGIDSFARGGVGATLNPLPDLGAPARADDDDDFDLLGVVESAAGALLGGGDDDSDSGDDADSGAFEDDVFSDDSGDSTPLGDAQAFDYQPDMPDGDDESLAGMPIKDGPPNTWVENPSGSGQLRLYDANGNAAADLDFDHDHGFGIPHAHNWDGTTRDLGNPVSLLPY